MKLEYLLMRYVGLISRNHSISDEGISWQEMKTTPDTFRDVTCSAASEGPPFCLKVSHTPHRYIL